MRQKAEAWRRYNSAALAEIVIGKLPEIAAAVAAPLANVDRIVLIGDSGSTAGVERVTRSVSEVLAQVPTVVEAMSGIDLGKIMARMHGENQPEIAPDRISSALKE